MKFVVDRTEFSKALATVDSCQDSGLLAVYGVVLLSARGGKLGLRGVGLGCDVSLSVSVDTEQTGEAAVDTGMLRAMVDSLGGKSVSVHDTEKNVILRAGNARRMLPKFPVEDFPAAPELDGSDVIWDRGVLGKYLGRVIFACAAEGDTSMPVLTGVCIDWDNGLIMATDRKKMVVQELGVDVLRLGGSSILPGKELGKLSRVAGFAGGSKARISKVGAKVRFEFDGAEMVLSTLMGAFPSQLMAELEGRLSEPAIRCSVPLEELKRIGTAVRAMTSSSASRYPLTFRFDGNIIELSLQVADVGQLEDRIQALDVEGSFDEPLLIDSRELSEIIRHLEGDVFNLAVGGAQLPVRVTSPNMPGWSLYLMPMVTREQIEGEK